MSRGNRDQQVDVMRPTGTLDERGQAKNSVVHYRGVFCSIKAVSGVEAEAGGQLKAITTYLVEIDGDPAKPLRQWDWLKWGERRLNIAAISDEKNNGCDLVLTCGERHEP